MREARLRPEFAHLYPALAAGVWRPAGVMADRVVAWLLRQSRGYVAPDRVLRPEHFEFRGGQELPNPAERGRRAGDAPPQASREG